MFLAHYYVGLPVVFLYSLFISFFLLYYFVNLKITNKFLFFIGVIHLTSLFLMPVMCCTLVLLPVNDLFIDYNDKVYRLIINIISYTNHVLNKLVYPFIEIYCSSGYISIFNKLCRLSAKQWIIDLFGIWYTILLIILYFFFKNFYDNTFEFLLNYLNILDLAKIYIEIGYALGSLNLLYRKAFTKKEEYENFLLGKLSKYEKKKKEGFEKDFKELNNINKLYIKDNPKFNELKIFIETINKEKILDEKGGLGLVLEPQKPEDKNMTEKQLENKISEPYENCKSYYRKFVRINNLRNDALNRNDVIKNTNCLDKLIKKCTSSQKCKKCFFVFYAIICIIIILLEIIGYDSPMLDSDNYRNTTAEYEKMQEEKSFKYMELLTMLIGYPIIFIALFIATGIYVLPLLYSLVCRRIITGDFLYARDSSDTIDLIVSLEKITENTFPCIYLSSVFYGTIYYKSKKEKFDLNALYFFDIPHSNIILYFRDVYLVISIIIPLLFEKIPLKCFKIIISDELYFGNNCCCYKAKRKEYIEEGEKYKKGLYNSEYNQMVNSDKK